MKVEDAIEFLELHRWKPPRNVIALEGFKEVEVLLLQLAAKGGGVIDCKTNRTREC